MCDTIDSKTVKTRKPHRCWGCTKEFAKGTDMLAVKSKDMGKIETAYWCPECMSADVDHGQGQCFGYGEFAQHRTG